METDHLKLSVVLPLYLTKEGLPKKECLYTMEQIEEALRLSLSDNPIVRQYQRHFGHSVMSHLGKKFRDHNCQWITPEIGGEVYYGFSKDEDKREASLQRALDRAKRTYAIANKQRSLLQKTLAPEPFRIEESA